MFDTISSNLDRIGFDLTRALERRRPYLGDLAHEIERDFRVASIDGESSSRLALLCEIFRKQTAALNIPSENTPNSEYLADFAPLLRAAERAEVARNLYLTLEALFTDDYFPANARSDFSESETILSLDAPRFRAVAARFAEEGLSPTNEFEAAESFERACLLVARRREGCALVPTLLIPQVSGELFCVAETDGFSLLAYEPLAHRRLSVENQLRMRVAANNLDLSLLAVLKGFSVDVLSFGFERGRTLLSVSGASSHLLELLAYMTLISEVSFGGIYPYFA